MEKNCNIGIATYNFEYALSKLKDGECLARTKWNPQNPLSSKKYIKLQDYNNSSHSFLYLTLTDGDIVPWQPTQADLLANDWHISA